jgi:hypothetical protein
MGTNTNLYDQDFYAWTQTTATLEVNALSQAPQMTYHIAGT